MSEGIDPAARRRQEAEARRAAERAHELRPTLADFWLREYRPRAAAGYAPRTLDLWDGLWRRHLLPALGDVRLHEITRRHCVLAIDAAEGAGPSAAAKSQRLLQAVLRSAVDRGILDASPAERLPTRSETAPRDRALSDAEIVEMWIGLDEMSAAYEVRQALRLILLTGQRPGEVVGMRWDEIDLPAALWRLPAERMKARRAHTVPLSRQALQIVDELRAVSLSATHALPSRYRVGYRAEHITVDALSDALRRSPPGSRIERLPHFTPHDLRRTCRTGLAALGVDHVVAERVLAHRMPGVAGVYDRHDYVPEMRAALQRWADHVERIVSGEALGNVVEMRGR